MEANLVTDNPNTGTLDNPVGSGPIEAVAGTSTNGGQAQGGAPTEELFKGFDPNRLPPEARVAYDSMLRDYRQKTATLAEAIKRETEKATQAYKQKAEFYDQFSSQEDFVNKWNAYVKEVQEQQARAAADPNNQTAELKKELAVLKTEFQKTAAYDAIDTFAALTDEKGQKLHGDFDKLNNITVSEIEENGAKRPVTMLEVAINAAPGKTFQEKLANGYKSAKAVYDTIFEEGKKAGLGRLANKMAYSTTPPTSVAPVGGIARRPKNALEALQFARQGLMPSKE